MPTNIASLGRRVLGGIVDTILCIILFAIYVVIFGDKAVDGSRHVSGFLALIMFIIIFLYFFILEATTGKTVGKYVARTKVVNIDGKKITWGQSFSRTFMRIIDGFFVYLVAFIAILASKNNQRLGDMVAKTFVIED